MGLTQPEAVRREPEDILVECLVNFWRPLSCTVFFPYGTMNIFLPGPSQLSFEAIKLESRTSGRKFILPIPRFGNVTNPDLLLVKQKSLPNLAIRNWLW